MTRAVTMFVVFITFVALAHMGGAGGMERVQGQLVLVRGAVTLLQSPHDRCQIAAPCSLSCVVCAAGLITKSTDLLHSMASAADLHRPLEGRMVSGRLYRPPKA